MKKRVYTPTYVSWKAMRSRCQQPGRENAKHYFERGITCDPRWDAFANFLADMGERPEGMTLDRRDNDKGYSKENCRWATPLEQTRNRRPVRYNYGEDNPRHKLSTEDVRQIFSLKGRETHEVIAARFGVARRTIGKIFSGERRSRETA